MRSVRQGHSVASTGMPWRPSATTATGKSSLEQPPARKSSGPLRRGGAGRWCGEEIDLGLGRHWTWLAYACRLSLVAWHTQERLREPAGQHPPQRGVEAVTEPGGGDEAEGRQQEEDLVAVGAMHQEALHEDVVGALPHGADSCHWRNQSNREQDAERQLAAQGQASPQVAVRDDDVAQEAGVGRIAEAGIGLRPLRAGWRASSGGVCG